MIIRILLFSVNLNAVDYVSGIDYISYSVLDNTASVLVYNNTIPGNTVNNANGQRKRRVRTMDAVNTI